MNSKIIRLVLVLAVSSLSWACASKFAKLQKNGTVQEKYKAAVKYYEAKDYAKAVILFEEITPLLRGDSTAEKAQFYNAYSNYYQGLYQMSSYLFKNFYATYANSPLAEEAFYMYALSMYKDAPAYNLDQANTITAIDALQTFINTFPQSEYAEKAATSLADLRKRLERKAYEKAKLYYKTSGTTIANFKAAAVSIDNFKRDFPDSEFIEELSYIQLISQVELANSSIFKLQKERYQKAIQYYHEFVDKYPNSRFLNESIKQYDAAQKGLSDVEKLQKQLDEEKAKAAAAKTSSTASTSRN